MIATQVVKVADNGNGTITATVKDVATGATKATFTGVAIQGSKNLFMFLEYTGLGSAISGAISTEAKSAAKTPPYDSYAIGRTICCSDSCAGGSGADQPCGGTPMHCDPQGYASDELIAISQMD